MRPFNFYHIIVPICLGLFLSAFIPVDMLPLTDISQEQIERGAMEEYIEKIEGVWLSEHRDSELGEPDKLQVEVQRTWIYQDKVLIKVSEYCQTGMADYLVFELIDNKLQYLTAKEGERTFPLLYLDFMEITYEIEEGEVVLYLESCEAEMENHLNRKLIRVDEMTTTPNTLL